MSGIAWPEFKRHLCRFLGVCDCGVLVCLGSYNKIWREELDTIEIDFSKSGGWKAGQGASMARLGEGGAVLLASSGWKPGKLLNILQGIIQPQMSLVLRRESLT